MGQAWGAGGEVTGATGALGAMGATGAVQCTGAKSTTAVHQGYRTAPVAPIAPSAPVAPASVRLLGQWNAKPFGHSVQGSAIDAHDLCGARPVVADLFQHV